jgi:hypothetical protein
MPPSPAQFVELIVADKCIKSDLSHLYAAELLALGKYAVSLAGGIPLLAINRVVSRVDADYLSSLSVKAISVA